MYRIFRNTMEILRDLNFRTRLVESTFGNKLKSTLYDFTNLTLIYIDISFQNNSSISSDWWTNFGISNFKLPIHLLGFPIMNSKFKLPKISNFQSISRTCSSCNYFLNILMQLFKKWKQNYKTPNIVTPLSIDSCLDF